MNDSNNVLTDTTQKFQLLLEELRKTHDDMQQKFKTLHEEFMVGQKDAPKCVVKKLRVNQRYTHSGRGTNINNYSVLIHKWKTNC